jgi:uncharacterized protein YjbI with pentapeptide repeats
MADEEQLAVLRRGRDAWNAWREQNPDVRVDLSNSDLSEEYLSGAKLSGAVLSGAVLSKADLTEADLSRAGLAAANLSRARLSGANLSEAVLSGANLFKANLSKAVLFRARLSGAVLSGANLANADLTDAVLIRARLSGANLSGAKLDRAILVETNFVNADLTGCYVYGISAWDLKLEGAKQENLIITPYDQPEITVDDLEVAQFIYLLLHNEKIRNVIDTVGKKAVLLLGRFTGGRIAIVKRLREELRKRDYVPMVFNFDKPETKDFTETVRLLAGLSRFVIADITNPRSTPLELQATVPECMVPFVPILEKGEDPFAMFQDLWVKHREWVLEPIHYSSVNGLVRGLDAAIVRPALMRSAKLMARKAEKYRITDIEEITAGAS